MAKADGFLTIDRETPERRPVSLRLADFKDVYQPIAHDKVLRQAGRCMDCGVPFCHNGCPIHNLIPDWNDLAHQGRWEEALERLHATNNFPEFTGRVCPAPCEAACVLGINQPAVAIKLIEQELVERGFQEGWVSPVKPRTTSGKRVAIVGSGPAGLAAAQQMARTGHSVTVFEKADRIGGLLRYGIPDFKLEKHLVDRRISQMVDEGVDFRTNCNVGIDLSVEELAKEFHAILLAGGAEEPRRLAVPGSELQGIHFAMDFLSRQNRMVAGDHVAAQISAAGKNVLILGGGDTGADCLGTCHRQSAASVVQCEIMPTPPSVRSEKTPWPLWPLVMRTESSHEEGGERVWEIATTGFSGDPSGQVKSWEGVRVGPPPHFAPVPATEFSRPVDLVLLALGFTGPVKSGLIQNLGVKLDVRGNVATDGNCMTSIPGVFAAGDMRRGQSLVVWAIAEGRRAAAAIDRYLAGKAAVPAQG